MNGIQENVRPAEILMENPSFAHEATMNFNEIENGLQKLQDRLARRQRLPNCCEEKSGPVTFPFTLDVLIDLQVIPCCDRLAGSQITTLLTAILGLFREVRA